MELGGTSYFFIVSASLQLLLGLIAFIAASILLLRFIRVSGCQTNVQVATLMMLWSAMLAHICWRATTIAIVLKPDQNILEAGSNGELTRQPLLMPLERAMVGCTLCLGTLSFLNVSLVWVKVARMSRHLTQSMKRGLSVYSRVVYVFEGLLVVGLAVLFGLGRTAYVAVFTAPFILFMIGCFAYGAAGMVEMLEEVITSPAHVCSDDESPDLSRTDSSASMKHEAKCRYNLLLHRVRHTSTVVVFALSLVFMSGFVYSAMTLLPANGQRSTMSPNKKVQTIVIFDEGVPFFILCATLAVLYYLYFNVLENVRASELSMKNSSTSNTKSEKVKVVVVEDEWSFDNTQIGSSMEKKGGRSSITVFQVTPPVWLPPHRPSCDAGRPHSETPL